MYYVPQLKFNKTMWNLYKVWFRYKYNLAGPEHEFANIEYLEDLIGEVTFLFQRHFISISLLLFDIESKNFHRI